MIVKIIALVKVDSSIILGKIYNAAYNKISKCAYLYHNDGTGFWLEKNQYELIEEKQSASSETK